MVHATVCCMHAIISKTVSWGGGLGAGARVFAELFPGIFLRNLNFRIRILELGATELLH